VPNSRDQRAFIEARTRERGFANVEVVTCDMNVFDTPIRRFDRVVSAEMVEHMRNDQELMARAARWLDPGCLFVHVFARREFACRLEHRDRTDWMARGLSAGSQMCWDDLLLHVQTTSRSRSTAA